MSDQSDPKKSLDATKASLEEELEQGLEQDLDRTVCFCHNVNVREILEAIRSGATTLAQIQAETLASTGCTGCEPEVLEILETELAKTPKKAAS